MRVAEIMGGLRIALSKEEFELVEAIKEKGKVLKKELTEHQAIVVKRLVTKGVLNRRKDNHGTFFVYNALENI